MHHADTRVDGLGRIPEVMRLVVDDDLAAVGTVDPGHDVAQRGLSRTVLAQERMDLAPTSPRSQRR